VIVLTVNEDSNQST